MTEIVIAWGDDTLCTRCEHPLPAGAPAWTEGRSLLCCLCVPSATQPCTIRARPASTNGARILASWKEHPVMTAITSLSQPHTESGALELEPLALQGLPGVVQYWQEGCWREYGRWGWTPVLIFCEERIGISFRTRGHARHLRKVYDRREAAWSRKDAARDRADLGA